MSTHDKEPGGGGWEELLALLDVSRVQAASKYHDLRRRLVRLFEWRGLADAEGLADETLDRVAHKLAEGETIRAADPVRYVCGVARLVALEAARAGRRLRPLTDAAEPPAREGDEAATDPRLRACLDECLGKMPETARALLLDYQVGDGGARISNRRRLADRLGVAMNALRIRVHRLRVDLERCLEDCAGGGGGGVAAS